MKIAMIGHKRIPSREGGAEIVVEEISTRLASRGHTVHAYNRKGNYVYGSANKYRNIKEYKGVKIKQIPTIPKKGLDALVYSFFAVIRALFGSYDVIHFHAEGPGVMISIARLFGIRTVSTIHGLDWKTSKWGAFARKYLLFGEKTIAKKADEIIVLNSYNQKYFLDNYKRNTNFIPNGVNKPEKRKPSLITEKYGLQGRITFFFLEG
ncbi:MAG: glycosyltransferase [Treponema sp.]|nr:glycosyltransferase [Treponema sp.]